MPHKSIEFAALGLNATSRLKIQDATEWIFHPMAPHVDISLTFFIPTTIADGVSNHTLSVCLSHAITM
ncbi:MAG: hypothetical protein IKV67_02400 [Paludibacteraceae bacterium]|nr:hypothetical protein [Paludibacteraceae bacterium]